MKHIYIFLILLIVSFTKAQCPTPTVTPLTRTLSCNGAPQTFTATHSPTTGFSARWYNPGSSGIIYSSTSGTNVLYANSPGIYTYLVFDLGFTCYSSQTVAVVANTVVPAFATVPLVGTVALNCYQPCISFSISTTSFLAPLTYTWTNLSTSVAAYPANSDYTICTPGYYRAEFKDGNACTVSQTISIPINTLVGTPVSPNDYTLCSTSTVMIAANTTTVGPSTYTWTGPVGSTISSPNSSVTAVNFAGTYTVAIRNNSNACIIYNTANVTACTRIDNLSSNEFISLFPNPNNGQFILKIDKDLQAGELVLSNYLGQEVYRQKILKGINAIKTNNTSSGVYIYTILNKNESLAKGKIVIE